MNTKTVNRKKIIENQRKILWMQAIDRLVQIDKIREYVLQLIEYSISLEPGKEKDACRISARNTAKLIDFDNWLVYERGKPSYKKYFSMRANYGIKYPIPSILENDWNIAYLPGKRLSKEEVLYNEECIILSKLFKIAESEYNPEKIYTWIIFFT